MSSLRPAGSQSANYDVTADGQRFRWSRQRPDNGSTKIVGVELDGRPETLARFEEGEGAPMTCQPPAVLFSLY
jgi:hypothetical protein